jgi:hypothetical protein
MAKLLIVPVAQGLPFEAAPAVWTTRTTPCRPFEEG